MLTSVLVMAEAVSLWPLVLLSSSGFLKFLREVVLVPPREHLHFHCFILPPLRHESGGEGQGVSLPPVLLLSI